MEHLNLQIPPSIALRRKRKRQPIDGSEEEEEESPLKPPFDAVSVNNALKTFLLNIHYYRYYNEALDDLFVKALTSLTKAGLTGLVGGLEDSIMIKYYLNLNRCGRALARDTATLLVDFVALLDKFRRLFVLTEKTMKFSMSNMDYFEKLLAYGPSHRAPPCIFKPRNDSCVETM